MTAVHTIAPADFDRLAEGYGGPRVIRALWRGQHSRRLLMLRYVAQRADPAPELGGALAVILDAERREPATTREILVEPMVGSWAAAVIRNFEHEVGHLGGVAASVALRTGARADLTARPRAGWLHLPATGRAQVPSDDAVRVRTDCGRLWLDGAEVDLAGAGWQARRSLSVPGPPHLHAALEDLDPYRDAYQVPAAGRLTTAQFAGWRRRLAATWRILTVYAPERAAELAEGLMSLVPLTTPDTRAAHSATSTESVGVIGLDLPQTDADFAVSLVHEFQHSKLSAMLDIEPLHHPGTTRTFRVPWRPDPRPVGGLLQGVYAFLGVADTWRALSADLGRFPQAAQEFAVARTWVSQAFGTLAGCGLLTPRGERFVAGMGRAVGRLEDGT